MDLKESCKRAKEIQDSISELEKERRTIESEIAEELKVEKATFLMENLVSISEPLEGSDYLFLDQGFDYYSKTVEGIKFIHIKER